MAVKKSPRKAQPERNKQLELDKQPEPELITTPVFLDTSSLVIPTLSQLQADGELKLGASVAARLCCTNRQANTPNHAQRLIRLNCIMLPQLHESIDQYALHQ